MSAGAPNKQQVLEDLKLLIDRIKDAYKVEDSELAASIFEDTIPVDAAVQEDLTVFESVTKYLHENRNKRFADIALILGRNQKTIWATYNRARHKRKKAVTAKSTVLVPLSIFRDNNLSPLESIVKFLLEKNMRGIDIARLLNKAPTTISTVKSRLGVKAHE